MILLEDHNKIIQDPAHSTKRLSISMASDTISQRLTRRPSSSCQWASGAGTNSWEYGVWDIMKREYADWISPEIEPDYDISLSFEIEKLPSDAEERAALVRSVALLKRNALAAPFERAFGDPKGTRS
ncbi:hypothetical protein PCASD_22720 [Puccinia coronata f. sp. avenae]|uniref:Arp2/3 complex 34 kDa subunit n=1 Tax=Puccinia coronata f. sp. avenae TaxID=200324 RepID=A0A2N5SE68_9BASI|nr:hypothetical protein PCASD_22720 [Puccinia coronata f. sp. avenae]